MNLEDANSGILIVDDDEQCLGLIRSFLHCHGINTGCASSGAEALAMMKERAFAVMITDFNMPGMDGLELARKALALAPDMPIILVTGDTSPEIPYLAMEAGIIRTFRKPFIVEEILAFIENR